MEIKNMKDEDRINVNTDFIDELEMQFAKKLRNAEEQEKAGQMRSFDEFRIEMQAKIIEGKEQADSGQLLDGPQTMAKLKAKYVK